MKREIKFNSFYSSIDYSKNLEQLFTDYGLFREKHFSNQCIKLLKEDYPSSEILLTHSATGALEMIALALDIQPGDEVILPSYTFVSTANAFALRGANLVFVDIEMDTLGIDPGLVREALTEKTKAIVGMHYAGHACKIEELRKIADNNYIFLIEDAAMAFGSKHKEKPLGSFGDFAVLSFDVTKHLSSTQGGSLLINNKKYLNKALNIYHLGTNREAYKNKKANYYEWVSLGSKYQMPETNAAILEVQLKNRKAILTKRQELSQQYYDLLNKLHSLGVNFSSKQNIKNNYHEFYLICRSENERKSLGSYLNENGIEALFHYIPIHTSKFGTPYKSIMSDNNTSLASSRLLRLPLHNELTSEDITYICSLVQKFFQND